MNSTKKTNKRIRTIPENREVSYVHNLNPKFQSRLPAILNEICESIMKIEPVVVDHLTTHLKEFQFFLDLEIDRAKLDISKATWESIVDVDNLNAMKAWLGKLEKLRDDFSIDKMKSMVDHLDNMVERIHEVFET